MTLDSDSGPPSGDVWRPEWIPPYCPPECRTACPPLAGIWTYSIAVFRNRKSIDPRTLRPRTRDVIVINGTEWYFDKYGCRKFDAEAAAQIGAGSTGATIFLDGTLNTLELAPYWLIGRDHLRALGVPAPGHVRLLPRGATGLTALAYAANR